MLLTIGIYSILFHFDPIDNVINAAFQFVKSFQNNWLIAQVLTDQFPGDSDAFGNSQFTWPMIVRLKKQALAAASFPTSRQLVKKALAPAQALASASFPRSRQLSKLPPSLRAACGCSSRLCDVVIYMWMEPLLKLYHEIVQIILQGLDPKAFNLFAGQLSICLTEAVWPRKSSGTLQSW